MRTPSPASESLPGLYAAWIDALVGGAIPAETSATCQACAMLPDGQEPPATLDTLSFHPDVKCCSYIPALPNFLVGHILLDRSDDAAAGRASTIGRVRAGVAVSPLGLAKPPTFVVLYRAGAAETFGRAPGLRCPHYRTESGACGIWRHRHAVCATWFCKHARGDVGLRFWGALRVLLLLAERALSVHCVRTLLSEPATLREIFQPGDPLDAQTLYPADLGGPADLGRARRMWGSYAGRELEFFEACGRIVTHRTTWASVERLGGVELAVAAGAVREEYRRLLSRAIPDALKVGNVLIHPEGADRAHLTTYSVYDPLSVPRHLLDVLHVFDGRPTRAAMAAAKEAGVEIDRAVVRRLVDFGVLVDATLP